MVKKILTITIDRLLGSHHPKYSDLIYPVNYGYVEGIMAADGEEQDAYVLGVGHPVKQFTGELIAIIHRLNDIEDKWVVVPTGTNISASEIKRQTEFQEKYFKTRIEMV